MFEEYETSKFPVESCTVPNEREPEVRDSTETFLCVLVDPRFPSECSLRVLRPYTCPSLDDPQITLYGWVDQKGQNTYDHFENSIHGDRERVVAWKPFRGDFTELISRIVD